MCDLYPSVDEADTELVELLAVSKRNFGEL